jgi:hypothetical protein
MVEQAGLLVASAAGGEGGSIVRTDRSARVVCRGRRAAHRAPPAQARRRAPGGASGGLRACGGPDGRRACGGAGGAGRGGAGGARRRCPSRAEEMPLPRGRSPRALACPRPLRRRRARPSPTASTCPGARAPAHRARPHAACARRRQPGVTRQGPDENSVRGSQIG